MVAAVQSCPVFLDRDATIEKAVRAHRQGGRARVPGSSSSRRRSSPPTPTGCGARSRGTTGRRTGTPGSSTSRSSCPAPPPRPSARRPAKPAPTSPSASTSATPRGTTLYNTLVYFGPDGHPAGQAPQADAHRRRAARVGDGRRVDPARLRHARSAASAGLTCWENYMPLARAAMYAQGIDVYLAPTWDNSDVWVPTLRHIAKEGRIFVIGSASASGRRDVPADIPGRDDLYGDDDDWLSPGHSARSSTPTATSSPGRSSSRRASSSPSSTSRSPASPAASSTRWATTPVPTCSAFGRHRPKPAATFGEG